MADTILHLLSPAYLFNRSLGPFRSDLAYIVLGLIIAGMLFSLIYRRICKKGDLFAKKVAHQVFNLALIMGFFGLLLLFVRQEGATYISAPIFLLIWAIITALWLIKIARYRFVVVPKRREQLSAEAQKKKYLS